MRRFAILLIALLGSQILTGCAVAHRYPAYRGRVLELGTDKPIEGAGVLASYWMTVSMPPERNSRYVGYQAVLTDKDGKFEIPSKVFSAFQPLAWFSSNVAITIYKRGYANFSGGFHVNRAKHGKSDPPIGAWMPPGEEVTFWFPKLETAEEIREHDRLISNMLPGDALLPEGMTRQEFITLFGGD